MKKKEASEKKEEISPFTPSFIFFLTFLSSPPSKTLPPPFVFGAIRLELSCFILYLRAFVQEKKEEKE
jgi:hypothetical protein